MKYFIFRNYTIEPFFKGLDAQFSGYEDISFIDKTAEAYIWFYLVPFRVNNDLIVKEIKHYSGLLDLIVSSIDTNKQIFIFNLCSYFKINYHTSDIGIEDCIIEYNQKIYMIAKNNANIKIIDIASFFNRFSAAQLVDWKYYFLAQIPFNPKIFSVFNKWFSHQLEIINMCRKKCIVVDLDNTIWSGILGEDGINGIKIGGEYPGNVFHIFQEYLFELSRIGIILTICSKNNEDDVLSVWEHHPEMVLHRHDFVTYRINWNNKAENIRDIARELNIGMDSMVFIDDSPSERELVKQMLPQVSVPDFPEQPYLYPEFMKELTENYFSTYNLTDEDIVKTRQYNENTDREYYKEQFVDINSYLRNLNIALMVEKLNKFNITRFAQMTQKTNQFNLTTHRYTELDIQLLADNGCWVHGLRVKDKFGDNGLTGLMIIKIDGETACIDTFLLSCRILGKGIEDVFIVFMLLKLKTAGMKKVIASFIKTAKNGQVENFFEKTGFEITESFDDYKKYELLLENKKEYFISDIYKLEEICGKE
jgi:FkbH-like protein